jgi:phosphoserine phosphatase RsbU/P
VTAVSTDEKKLCLLIVDDEDDFRTAWRNHYQDLGHELVEAANGAEAWELFRANPLRFDLVLTDILMPKMRGDALIGKLREIRPFLPIIGVTGVNDLKSRLATFGSGAYYYLDKPLPPWEIVDRIVAAAIRVHGNEESIHTTRTLEAKVARLVRQHIIHSAGAPSATGEHWAIGVDAAVEAVESAHPGGDFVELFERQSDEMVFYVADASGHNNIVACFLACLASMILHKSHHRGRPMVDELIRTLHAALQALRQQGALEDSRYLTFFMGSIDFAKGELSFVNAGHPAALLLRQGDGTKVEHLASTCMPIGVPWPLRETIKQGPIPLHGGDILFVYSDGASELLGDGDNGAGLEVIERLVRAGAAGGARELVDRVADELKRRVGKDGFEDDVTLLAIKVAANPAP